MLGLYNRCAGSICIIGVRQLVNERRDIGLLVCKSTPKPLSSLVPHPNHSQISFRLLLRVRRPVLPPPSVRVPQLDPQLPLQLPNIPDLAHTLGYPPRHLFLFRHPVTQSRRRSTPPSLQPLAGHFSSTLSDFLVREVTVFFATCGLDGFDQLFGVRSMETSFFAVERFLSSANLSFDVFS